MSAASWVLARGAFVVALACAGCAGGGAVDDAGADGNGGGNAPIVQIIEPGAHATVAASGGVVTVAIIVANFTLAGASSCPVTANACGQARINVDGDDCDAAGQPYAAQGASMSFAVDLRACRAGLVNGASHQFTARLVDAMGALVPGASSTVIATVQTM